MSGTKKRMTAESREVYQLADTDIPTIFQNICKSSNIELNEAQTWKN